MIDHLKIMVYSDCWKLLEDSSLSQNLDVEHYHYDVQYLTMKIKTKIFLIITVLLKYSLFFSLLNDHPQRFIYSFVCSIKIKSFDSIIEKQSNMRKGIFQCLISHVKMRHFLKFIETKKILKFSK